MRKLRNEILFLQLEDSNYMLGEIEAVQTVTCYLCKVNFMYVSRVVEYQNFFSTFYNVFLQSPLLKDIRFFLANINLSLIFVHLSIRIWKI